MKSSRFALPLFAVLLGTFLPDLSAVEIIRLDTLLYVFKDADFDRIAVGTNESTANGAGIVFNAPVTLSFDRRTLVLSGEEYSWNGGRKPPAGFSLLSAPSIVTRVGMPATLFIAEPVQYLEKAADGSLQVRSLPGDSPDGPHFEFTLDPRPSGSAPNELVVSCQLDLATLKGREKIQGVDLEVGRPILAQFKGSFKFTNPLGGWSGLLVRCPSGGDYSMLLLLKVSAADDFQPPANVHPAKAVPATSPPAPHPADGKPKPN